MKNGLVKEIWMMVHRLVLDHDGINPPEKLFEWNWDKEYLTDFFKQKGAKEIITVGQDLISVF